MVAHLRDCTVAIETHPSREDEAATVRMRHLNALGREVRPPDRVLLYDVRRNARTRILAQMLHSLFT